MLLGEFKWLTVVSPDGLDDIELLLEPNANPATKMYQEAIFKQGIPATAFNVDDIYKEFERLKSLNSALCNSNIKNLIIYHIFETN